MLHAEVHPAVLEHGRCLARHVCRCFIWFVVMVVMMTGARLLVSPGGWQLSQGHHEGQEEATVLASMVAHVEEGITAFDCGDIYTGEEPRPLDTGDG
jgi:hypothetical protein